MSDTPIHEENISPESNKTNALSGESISSKNTLENSYSSASEIPSASKFSSENLLADDTRLGILVKTTLIDYPGRVATTLFLQGCNLRCPYCYNVDLVVGSFNVYKPISAGELFDYLEKRKNVLTGFVISGGEPTISPYLELLIEKAKSLDYHIKLDTNGTMPERIAKITSEPSLMPDFIAIDVKTSPSRYAELGWEDHMSSAVKCSLKLIENMSDSIKREYRTVLVPGLVTKSEIKEMASYLPPNASWKFAPFRQGTCVDPVFDTLTPYTQEQMDDLVSYAQSFIKGATLR